jgi:murein DD-endopeptidase MepM/ murein hydrolase activator NlpD
LLVLAVGLVVALVASGAAWSSADTTSVAGELPSSRRYRPPTDAPVLDPFRPPPEPWLAGNRGIEYATGPGAAIVAIGPGVVSFAGAVAGRLVVTVTHPDGLRSSYVGLGAIHVVVGHLVQGGQPVGTAHGPVHLGVRRQDAYLDPALLWGSPVRGGRSVLVPVPP